MKMLAEYLDKAIAFERMAADEKDPKLKADLEKQAAAYRKLAMQRARQYTIKLRIYLPELLRNLSRTTRLSGN